ncbi:RadC family protein [Myxococcota bacterium]
MMKTIRNFEMKVRRVRIGEQQPPYGQSISTPERVAEIAKTLIGECAQESFCVFLLDVKNLITGYSEVGRGGIDSCPVDPRAVFRAAIATGASSIIVAHNHPSGDPEPSRDDLDLTEKLSEGAELLGLTLLDHVIVTDEDTVSLRGRGLIA